MMNKSYFLCYCSIDWTAFVKDRFEAGVAITTIIITIKIIIKS